MNADFKPYQAIPDGWAIVREEHQTPVGVKTYYYGLEKATGKETNRQKMYHQAINAIHLGWFKQ